VPVRRLAKITAPRRAATETPSWLRSKAGKSPW
jgi:hypothetical protein